MTLMSKFRAFKVAVNIRFSPAFDVTPGLARSFDKMVAPLNQETNALSRRSNRRRGLDVASVGNQSADRIWLDCG
jgi:hypothetical protein